MAHPRGVGSDNPAADTEGGQDPPKGLARGPLYLDAIVAEAKLTGQAEAVFEAARARDDTEKEAS